MPQENKFNLSIIIPVFNEEQYLDKLFSDLKKYFNQKKKFFGFLSAYKEKIENLKGARKKNKEKSSEKLYGWS